MAGRRPEVLEKRIGKGNPQRRPLPENAPERVIGRPEAPAWLVGSGRTCWDEVGGLLQKRGQLSLDSGVSLLALCQCYSEWIDLAKDLRENGRFHLNAEGIERARPAVGAFQDCDRRLKGWLVEFGLTDASRGKVVASGEEAADNPLSRYGLN